MISRFEHGFITLGYVALLHKYAKFNGEQEKESIFCENMGQKIHLSGELFFNTLQAL